MVEESINLQVLHWPTPQGKVPQGDDNSWGRLLWTRVSWIFSTYHEMRLISKLGTVHPHGINERFSYI